MSKQTKIIAIVGGVLIVAAAAFYFGVANKDPAPRTERGAQVH